MDLIDGYNLLFAAGFAPRGRAPGLLQRQREAFIKALAERLTPHQRAHTLVVFDAKRHGLERFDGSRSETLHGLRLDYALDHDEADERIGELIPRYAAAGSRVISTDRKVRLFAKHSRVVSVTSEAYWTEISRPSTPREETEDRDRALTPSEIAAWQANFGDVRLDDLSRSDHDGSTAYTEPAGAETARRPSPPPSTATPPVASSSRDPGSPRAARSEAPSPRPQAKRRSKRTRTPRPSSARTPSERTPPDRTPMEQKRLDAGRTEGEPIFPPGYGQDLLDDPSQAEEDAPRRHRRRDTS